MNLTGITALEKSKWVKLDAVWKTDKTFLLYVNGAQAGTGTLKNQAANGNQTKLALGGALAPTANDQKSGRGVYGDMDEIRLRAGALSPYYVRAVVSNTLDAVLTTPAISFATSPPRLAGRHGDVPGTRVHDAFRDRRGNRVRNGRAVRDAAPRSVDGRFCHGRGGLPSYALSAAAERCCHEIVPYGPLLLANGSENEGRIRFNSGPFSCRMDIDLRETGADWP